MRPEHFESKTLNEILEVAWSHVTPELKDRMRAAMSKDEALAYLDEKDHGLGFHFGGGMAARNRFRATIPDADLPPFDEYYGAGTDVRNWDDYYDNALKLVAGQRD